MTDSKRLRVGVVGSGFGATVHVPAFQAHPRFEVVAIASPSRANAIAAERGIAHSFPSCAQMVAGVELDVVSIASPPVHHHEDVLAALARGKHVLCEKPFALNLTQAEELYAAAQRAGTVCALAFEFRYLPERIATRELISNGHLGPLRQL
ncbi:MAG TPA: Gfo/Idh/MocA family oxidoreductase, partial [Candidatus Baltobacteraceae bacterium]